jgi:hypothetical protein
MKFRVKILAISAAAILAPLAAMAADNKASDAPKAEKPAAVCQQATGSRIKSHDTSRCDKSSNGAFRSYSAESLQETGAIDLAEALRRLDPAFR